MMTNDWLIIDSSPQGASIGTVNDELKNVCQIEHTRHRSIDNFATNPFAGLIAYNLLPKKPAMNLEIIDRSRLIA